MTKSKIEWTDRSWNPIRGCSRVSEGCRNCYAERQAARFAGPGEPFHDYVSRPIAARIERDLTGNDARWTGKVALVPEKLDEPLRWRAPSRVFVNSMSDLFHEALSDEDIAAVFGVMAAATQHTFQVLTKRPDRMRQWFDWAADNPRAACRASASLIAGRPVEQEPFGRAWPLPNVWLGVSVEDQVSADERIPLLLATPAALRFVSAEPILSSIQFSGATALRPRFWLERPKADDFDSFMNVLLEDRPRIDWLIVGGESGPGSRPCDVAWIRSAVAQCKAAGVPVFVKQVGAMCVTQHPMEPGALFHVKTADRRGGDPFEWTEDLRVREFPRTVAP